MRLRQLIVLFSLELKRYREHLFKDARTVDETHPKDLSVELQSKVKM